MRRSVDRNLPNSSSLARKHSVDRERSAQPARPPAVRSLGAFGSIAGASAPYCETRYVELWAYAHAGPGRLIAVDRPGPALPAGDVNEPARLFVRDRTGPEQHQSQQLGLARRQ